MRMRSFHGYYIKLIFIESNSMRDLTIRFYIHIYRFRELESETLTIVLIKP